MFQKKFPPARYEAQELVFQADDAADEKTAIQLCRQALKIYPDCVDALTLLADLESHSMSDYVKAMSEAVLVGQRELGEEYFEQMAGHFWLDLDTRPLMRAMAGLAEAAHESGVPGMVEQAIDLYETMLVLNPNDNQGVRDPLAGCYLQRKCYDELAELLEAYKADCSAVPLWARVLLALALDDEKKAIRALKKAREQNAHVESYLTGQKRRPRNPSSFYSPGKDSEAVFCANTLWEAWKAHPKAKRWLKSQCGME